VIPESDTPSMDIENVDMNYKTNVHECSQRIILVLPIEFSALANQKITTRIEISVLYADV